MRMRSGVRVIQRCDVPISVEFDVDRLWIVEAEPRHTLENRAAQSSGTGWLGGTAGRAVGWSDTQVVATVAMHSFQTSREGWVC